MMIIDSEQSLPPQIREELRQIEEMMGIDPLLHLLEAVKEDVANKPLASRFSTTKPVSAIYGDKPLSAAMRLALEANGDTEAAYKKGELNAKLIRLIGQVLTLVEQTKAVVAEVRCSQMEFNSVSEEVSGSH